MSRQIEIVNSRWKVFRYARNLLLLAALFCSLITVPHSSRASEIKLPGGATVTTSPGWVPSEQQYRDAVLLVVPAPKPGPPLAHMLITYERRRSHEEAVMRLGQTVAEYVKPTRTFSINGWPAIERRYLAPEPMRGEEREPGKPPRIVVWVTTAIAFEELLIRFDTTLSAEARATLADQAQVIAHSATLPVRQSPADLKSDFALTKQGKTIQRPPSRTPARNSTLYLAPMRSFGTPAVATGASSEIEIAASSDGKNIVVSTNNGLSVSNNGGQSFNAGPVLAAQGNTIPDGDLSIAIGASGTFYVSRLDFFAGSTKSIEIFTSGDNGSTFPFRSFAFSCHQM
jgi:hypothetical protein